MPAYQARTKWQEVPLRPGSLQNGLGINTHFIENQCQLIDQRNIQIALRIFNNFCSFGNLDALGLVSASNNDCVVQRIDKIGDFWS
ncbi:hypothetical protein D3C81_1548800 [compost metagenome]